MENTFGDKPYSYMEDPANKLVYIDLPPVPQTLPMDSDVEKLQAEIADLQKRLVAMTELKEKWYNSNQSAINASYTRENAVRSWLIEQVSENDLKREPAEALASIMGFEATRTVSISGTVSFTGELEVSIFESEPEFSQYDAEINYFDVAINGEDVVNLDYGVEDLNVDLY
jgi:hypothetical protein